MSEETESKAQVRTSSRYAGGPDWVPRNPNFQRKQVSNQNAIYPRRVSYLDQRRVSCSPICQSIHTPTSSPAARLPGQAAIRLINRSSLGNGPCGCALGDRCERRGCPASTPTLTSPCRMDKPREIESSCKFAGYKFPRKSLRA